MSPDSRKRKRFGQPGVNASGPITADPSVAVAVAVAAHAPPGRLAHDPKRPRLDHQTSVGDAAPSDVAQRPSSASALRTVPSVLVSPLEDQARQTSNYLGFAAKRYGPSVVRVALAKYCQSSEFDIVDRDVARRTETELAAQTKTITQLQSSWTQARQLSFLSHGTLRHLVTLASKDSTDAAAISAWNSLRASGFLRPLSRGVIEPYRRALCDSADALRSSQADPSQWRFEQDASAHAHLFGLLQPYVPSSHAASPNRSADVPSGESAEWSKLLEEGLAPTTPASAGLAYSQATMRLLQTELGLLCSVRTGEPPAIISSVPLLLSATRHQNATLSPTAISTADRDRWQ